MAASAVAILRHRALPAWVGFVSIVDTALCLAVVAFDGELAGIWILAGAAWIATLSIVIFLRRSPR